MRKRLTKIFWNIEVWAVQKHVNLVDLVKSFPTNIFLQNLASIQQRTSLLKFDHLAEKSESAVRYRTFQRSGSGSRRGRPWSRRSAAAGPAPWSAGAGPRCAGPDRYLLRPITHDVKFGHAYPLPIKFVRTSVLIFSQQKTLPYRKTSSTSAKKRQIWH